MGAWLPPSFCIELFFWQILTKRVPFVSFSPLKELHDKKYNWQFSCLLFLLTKQKTPQTIYIGCFYRNFSSQVRSMKQFDLFDRPGRHTFFIPVDSAFENLGNFKSTFKVCQPNIYWSFSEMKLVDKDIIAGHIVPDNLLFTEPLNKREQKTRTYTDGNSIKVTTVIQQTSEGCKFSIYFYLIVSY